MATRKKTAEPLPIEAPAPVVVVTAAEPDLDTHSERITKEMTERLFAPSKTVNRPDISRLPDAFADGLPLFRCGDKIVIERYAGFLPGSPYLDTKTYRVMSIDGVTGRLDLYDDSFLQFAIDNWKTGMRNGQVYKLAAGNTVTTKRKRGRPRKNPVEAVAAAPKGEPEKKKRGRPKGSKNRPKEEIRAERVAKAASRAAKRVKKPRKTT